ncbi:MAG: hypothetical protein KF678_01270 [Phycisphaeraceae bacterium]|nr:hypothetical protein [Phycisphaeraceae bacterium]
MSTTRPAVPTVPAHQRVLCPYCGEVSADPRRCDVCRGHFDPLSRQASQNAMGPWFIRDDSNPWRPGCSIETLRELIRRGKVTRDTVIRGPGTKQFWNFAGRTPSVANLLGLCHNCRAAVKPDDYSCKACGAHFSPDPDRQHLGLAPVHLLPGDASPEIVAAASLETPGPAPVPVALTTGAKAEVMVPAAAATLPAATTSRTPSAAAPPPEASEQAGRSLAPWLIGVTVAVLIGMGVVIALVLTDRLSIPWLQDQPAATGSESSVPAPHADSPAQQPGEPTPNEPPHAPAAGEPGPTSEVTPSVNRPDFELILQPLLDADPFSEQTILDKIEELRRAHPERKGELDAWTEAAKTKAQRLRLRGIP